MKKRINKKLSIKKQTITNLNNHEQQQLRGAGTVTSALPPCIICPPTYTCNTDCGQNTCGPYTCGDTCQYTCLYNTCPLCP